MPAVAARTAPSEPERRWTGPRLPAPLVAGTGLALVVGVILYGALAGAPLSVWWIALAILGCAMQVAAPALDRPAPKPSSAPVTRPTGQAANARQPPLRR